MNRTKNGNAHTFLLYAQDGKGMGHIARTTTIARHLLAAYPNSVAYITTESPAIAEFTLPDRCDYLKLPVRLTPAGIHGTDAEEVAARDRFRMNVRSRILREAALALQPDLVLVDHEPLGRKGEFRDGLFALKEQSPETTFIFGLRDIMDGVSRTREMWQELGVYDALEHLYDGIAVYGSQELYDVAKAYAIPPSVVPKLHYCGYVVRELPVVDSNAIRRQHGLPSEGPLLIATVGGGSDGYGLLAAAQKAILALQAERPDLCAILVTGPLMPGDQRSILQAQDTPRCRVVAHADNLQLMAVADAIVSMGGYNSVCEALSVGRPLVIVPRSTHKVEQQVRAQTLAAHGLARWIHPKDLCGENLVEAIAWALSLDRGAHARRVREVIPAFDGAARLTDYLAPWLGGPELGERSDLETVPVLERIA
jgi:predicted glycosyltransferase